MVHRMQIKLGNGTTKLEATRDWISGVAHAFSNQRKTAEEAYRREDVDVLASIRLLGSLALVGECVSHTTDPIACGFELRGSIAELDLHAMHHEPPLPSARRGREK